MAEKGIDESAIFASENMETLQEVLKTIKFDVLAGKGKPINVKSATPVEKPNSQLSTGVKFSLEVIIAFNFFIHSFIHSFIYLLPYLFIYLFISFSFLDWSNFVVRGLSITGPTRTEHNLHVTYDQKTKEFKVLLAFIPPSRLLFRSTHIEGIPETLMTILRKHGINSVTQENIQQVSTLLQSLDIPFDLSGRDVACVSVILADI
jgi:hypothetical protein